VAHSAYGALAAIDTGHIGGVERQQSLMARWLAGRGYQVSMITWDEGQGDRVRIGGVRVVKMCPKDAGIKAVRFLWPRWTSLARAMRRADADIYYYNRGDLGLGQVALWCRRHRRKCVYSVASDADCDPALPVLAPRRERWLYRYGLRHADRVIVQTRRQRQMLREGFGIRAAVVPMPCEQVRRPSAARPSANGPPHVLWIGRISPEKRLELLLDTARQCPDTVFDVVGTANAQTEYASTLTRRAAEMANVVLHGRRPHAELGGFYGRAKALCCTSAYEGLPNTFLEAWSLGLPVLSTFDPDGVIAEHGLGWCASSVAELVAGIHTAVASPRKWRAASRAARLYYRRNHRHEPCMERFDSIFREVAR